MWIGYTNTSLLKLGGVDSFDRQAGNNDDGHGDDFATKATNRYGNDRRSHEIIFALLRWEFETGMVGGL